MTAIIINLDDYRQEKEPETPMEAGLKALKDTRKICQKMTEIRFIFIS